MDETEYRPACGNMKPHIWHGWWKDGTGPMLTCDGIAPAPPDPGRLDVIVSSLGHRSTIRLESRPGDTVKLTVTTFWGIPVFYDTFDRAKLAEILHEMRD